MVTAAAQASRAAIKVDEARAKGNIKEDQKQQRQQQRFQNLGSLCSDAGGILAAAAASKNAPLIQAGCSCECRKVAHIFEILTMYNMPCTRYHVLWGARGAMGYHRVIQ